MKKKETEYIHLKPKQMLLMLELLGYKLNKCKCQYCDKKLKEGKFGIYPAIDKRRKATFVCGSILCLNEYFEDIGE